MGVRVSMRLGLRSPSASVRETFGGCGWQCLVAAPPDRATMLSRERDRQGEDCVLRCNARGQRAAHRERYDATAPRAHA